MNWLNIRIPTLRQAAYIGSEPAQRAAWLNVLAYCAEQENAGRIVGARAWKDRQWQQTCGVTLDEVTSAKFLILWDGDDALVWEYPTEKEAEVQAKRVAGKRGGKAKARYARESGLKLNPSSATGCASSSAGSSANGCASTEREEEGNRKGKEVEREEEPPPPHASPSAPESDEANQQKRLPTSAEAKAVAELFNRRETTEWAPKEIKAYKDCMKRKVLTMESIGIIAPYYAAERAKNGNGIHRRDIKTFLNNFDGELDRAKAFSANPRAHSRTNGKSAAAHQQPTTYDPDEPL